MNFLTKNPNSQKIKKIKNNQNILNSQNIKKILINSFQTIQTIPKINAEFSNNLRAEFSVNSSVATPLYI